MIGAVVLRDERNEIIAISVELMDLKEAARYLHLCYETVRRWAKAGEFPAVKVGGAWRVYDLEAWLNKHKVGGASIDTPPPKGGGFSGYGAEHLRAVPQPKV